MDPLPSFIRLSPEQLQKLGGLIFEKDYTSKALIFLENPARTLHYWSEEPNILPHDDGARKRHRYSFFDLLWLKLISDLREFGMGKAALFNLKKELLIPINMEELSQKIQAEHNEIEQLMKVQFGKSHEEIKALFDTLQERKTEITQQQATKLYAHTWYTLGQQKVVRLLINKSGNCFPYYEGDVPGLFHMERDKQQLGKVYCVVNLTDLITDLLSIDSIKDTFKEAFFTKEEWNLLQFLRGEKPHSILVTYKGERMDLLKIVRRKHISPEARLNEILLKNAYETIEIESINGSIIQCISTQKHKL